MWLICVLNRILLPFDSILFAILLSEQCSCVIMVLAGAGQRQDFFSKSKSKMSLFLCRYQCDTPIRKAYIQVDGSVVRSNNILLFAGATIG